MLLKTGILIFQSNEFYYLKVQMQPRKIRKERNRKRRTGRYDLNHSAALEEWHAELTQEKTVAEICHSTSKCE